MKKKNISVFITAVLAVFLVAFIGNSVTDADTEWYQAIKPELTPPDFVFPIVWTALYFLIILSIYFSWTSSKPGHKKKLFALFAINLVFNAHWSVMFFGYNRPVLAFIDLIIIWITALALIFYTYRINRLSSYFLVPYLLWITFAGIINFIIAF